MAKCAIDIKKDIIDLAGSKLREGGAEVQGDVGFFSNPNKSTKVINDINKEFNSLVIKESEKGSFTIDPPNLLVNAYLQAYESQNPNSTLLSKESESTQVSKTYSPKTIAKLKEFLNRIGVDYKTVSQITIDGRFLPANGIAKLLENLIEVVDGKESSVLTEETAHFAVAILEQTNPKLFNQMLSKIGSYNIYTRVLEEYSDDPLYRNQDGTRNIRKLKVEAIGKVLAETFILKEEGSIEKPENLAIAQNWWRMMIDWFTGLFQKPGFNPFEEAATLISENTLKGTAADIKIADSFASLSEKDKEVQFNREDFIKAVEETKKRSALIPEGNDNSYYTWDGKRVAHRVTDRTKMKDYESSEFDLYKKDTGTGGHHDLEDIARRYVDKNGDRRSVPLAQTSVSELNPVSNKLYEVLEKNFIERLNSYPKNTKFFFETRVYDPTYDEMGTIDFIAITEDNKVDVLDWKFIAIKEGQKDIPTSKKESWIKQMSQYKYILNKEYNIPKTSFNKTFMVPIVVNYNTAKNRVTNKDVFSVKGIKIGAVNYKLEKEVPLIPLAVGKFSSGNKQIDDLIEQFNTVIETLKNKRKGKDDRNVYDEIIQNYTVAIRKLQMQNNGEDVANIAASTIIRIGNDMKTYSKIIDLPDTNLMEIESVIQADKLILQSYLELDIIFAELLDRKDKKNAKLVDDMSDVVRNSKIFLKKFEDLENEIAKKIGEGVGVKNVLKEEQVLGWWGRQVRSFSQAGIKTAQVLYKYYQEAVQSAAIKFDESIGRLTTIEKELSDLASSTGISKLDLINKYLIEEGLLIDKFDNEIRQQLKNILDQTDKKKVREFINKYVDQTAYNEWYESQKKKTFESIDKQRWEADDKADYMKKEYLKNQFVTKYDISKAEGLSSANNRLKYFFNNNAWSDKFKEINKTENKALLDLYNYTKTLNDKAAEMGAIRPEIKNRFIPNVRKSYVDNFVQGGDKSVFKALVNQVRINPDDATFGAINPITKEIENRIPVNFTSDIPVTEKSTDLLKTLALFEKELIQYEWRSELEDVASMLVDVERRKSTIVTDSRGRAKFKDNEIQTVPKNKDSDLNTEYLKKFVDYYIYGRKLGSGNDGGWTFNTKTLAEKVNKKVGFNLMDVPEENPDNEVTISATKLVQSANRWFQMKTLGLNLTTAVANLAGGTLNSMINAGKYFTKKDYVKGVMRFSSNKFTGEEGKVYAGLMDYFIPLLDNQEMQKINSLSVSKAANLLSSEWLFELQRTSDKFVTYPLLIAMLDNTMIVNGELVNIPEYVRKENGYLNRIRLSEGERKALEEKIDKEIREFKETKAISKVAKIENDTLVIPGIERDSSTVHDFRNLVQQITKNIMGNSSTEDISQYRMSILGQSFMMFKNWIPRLAEVRFGGLRENVGTDSWEYGRLRMLARVIMTNAIGSMKNLYNITAGNDAGIKFISEIYKKKVEEFAAQGGDVDDFISLEEFTEMYHRGIKMAAKETAFWLGLVGMVVAAGAATPPDKEDPTSRNIWKFSLRALDKIKDELGFFYNPQSMLDIAGGGVFPSINTVRDGVKFLNNLSVDIFAELTGNEELGDKTKTAKYFFRSFPITKELLNYVAIFNKDLADELGIAITDQYRSR